MPLYIGFAFLATNALLLISSWIPSVLIVLHLFFHLVFICAQLQMQKEVHKFSGWKRKVDLELQMV